MTETNVKGRGIVVPNAPVLAMANRFGRYKPEEEKAVRKVEVKEDETLRKMKNKYRKLCEFNDRIYEELESNGIMDVDEAVYRKAVDMTKRTHYSSRDVERFSVALKEFEDEDNPRSDIELQNNAGIFLSALINNGNDSDYVIHTAHLTVPLDFIGYQNTKNVTVNGDAGRWAGDSMQGGTVTVNGNAGAALGREMKGGEIHINGEMVMVADFMRHGKIFHKGKLIVDK
ncbi:hypothetical protein H0O00_04475 [Candidatus Micrarchaeota archaeon]|nr:hypothetical protein [Candidatus Micrarchaeota archaeon]